MRTVSVRGSGPGTQLVAQGSGMALIGHQSTTDDLVYLGDTNNVDPNDSSNVVPLVAPGYVVVDGSRDVYAKCATPTGTAIVYVIDGGVSYFQPSSQLVVVGTKAGIFIYSPTTAAGNLAISITSAAGTDIYGNAFVAGIQVHPIAATAANITVGDLAGNNIVLSGASGEATFSNVTSDSHITIKPNAGFLLGSEILFTQSGSTSGVVRATTSLGPVGILVISGGIGTVGSITFDNSGVNVAGPLNSAGVIAGAVGISKYGSPVKTRVGVSNRQTNVAVPTATVETVIDTITVNLIAGQVYDIMWTGWNNSTVTTDVSIIRMRQDTVTGTAIDSGYITHTANGTSKNTLRAQYTALATAVKTFVVTMIRFSGTGTLSSSGAATGPDILTVDMTS
jgi:hypothetical protein